MRPYFPTRAFQIRCLLFIFGILLLLLQNGGLKGKFILSSSEVQESPPNSAFNDSLPSDPLSNSTHSAEILPSSIPTSQTTPSSPNHFLTPIRTSASPGSEASLAATTEISKTETPETPLEMNDLTRPTNISKKTLIIDYPLPCTNAMKRKVFFQWRKGGRNKLFDVVIQTAQRSSDLHFSLLNQTLWSFFQSDFWPHLPDVTISIGDNTTPSLLRSKLQTSFPFQIIGMEEEELEIMKTLPIKERETLNYWKSMSLNLTGEPPLLGRFIFEDDLLFRKDAFAITLQALQGVMDNHSRFVLKLYYGHPRSPKERKSTTHHKFFHTTRMTRTQALFFSTSILSDAQQMMHRDRCHVPKDKCLEQWIKEETFWRRAGSYFLEFPVIQHVGVSKSFYKDSISHQEENFNQTDWGCTFSL